MFFFLKRKERLNLHYFQCRPCLFGVLCKKIVQTFIAISMSSSLRSEIYILSVLLQTPLILLIEVVFPSPQLWHHTSCFTSLMPLFRCFCRISPPSTPSSPQQHSAQHALNLQEQNREMWTAWRSAHDWWEEEELEAPTTTSTITRGGAHPQVLGRTVALTTSSVRTAWESWKISQSNIKPTLVTDDTHKGKFRWHIQEVLRTWTDTKPSERLFGTLGLTSNTNSK